MQSIDITRNGFAPTKRYSGVLHTQGSVLLDADQNDAQLIDRQEDRRTTTDLLVTAGSPDNGFRIDASGAAADPYDFLLKAGTYYLAGLRLDIPQDERFRLQTEWLQQRANDTGILGNDWLPATLDSVEPTRPVGPRTDLVWLEGWEQPITGAEDGELVETAFGVESSARLRPMRKVHVFPNAGTGGCAAGFAGLVAALQATGRFTYDAGSHQLRSNRRMQVDFVDVGAAPDPCTPSQRRGFLGAENETIQVRVLADDRFIWSFSNAAPLYRARFKNPTTLHLDAPPRDALLRPLVGDVIEIVRCDAILSNGELIGERHGMFYRVGSSYDPASGDVVIEANAIFALPVVNDTAHAAALAAAQGTPAPDGHLYARLWRGESVATGGLGKAFAAGTPVQLGTTGLTVNFTGNGPVGDSWTFSVRPNTPELVAPWEMSSPCPPSSPHRHIAGLGLLTWNAQAVTAITDCRRRVRKLENASGCCEVTVGDNQESFGDVSTIKEALDLLPASGGKICLLRGSFTETVQIAGQQDIIIEGCGKLTRLRGATGDLHPVIGLTDCEGIKLRSFAIEANDRIAVAIDDSGTFDFGEHTRAIALERLLIASRDAPAVVFNGGEGLAVEDCQVTLATIAPPTTSGTVNGMAAAILLFGADMRVERCVIGGQVNVDRAELPIGGIHVIGGSERVEIRRNRIAWSAGHGITLGSVSMVPKGSAISDLPLRTRLPMGASLTWPQFAAGGSDPTLVAIIIIVIIVISPDGCNTTTTTIPGTTVNGTEYVPDADPLIVGCRIIDNDISGMGECGIAPFAQFDLSVDKQFCGVAGLEIRENRIRDCTRNEAAPVKDGAIVHTARGGVVLGWAEELDFVDNVIEGCGSARNVPICGFFAAALAHARIARNRIHDNGLRVVDLGVTVPFGQRGGIVIRSVMPGTVPVASVWPWVAGDGRLQNGREALILHGNDVSAPEGRALQVQGVGAMSITDNQLTSLGASAASAFWTALAGSLLGGATAGVAGLAALAPLLKYDFIPTLMGNAVVSVVNMAFSADLFAMLPFGLGRATISTAGGIAKRPYISATGRVLFNANQTRFDGLALPIAVVPVMVGLVSIDDVTMSDNQCDADFIPGGLDWPMVHGCVIAASLRMASNRFSEPDIGDPRDSTLPQLSGLCAGISVFMHHNFGTHCFLAMPKEPTLSEIEPNRAVVDLNDGLCARMGKRFEELLGSLLAGTTKHGFGLAGAEDLDLAGSGIKEYSNDG